MIIKSSFIRKRGNNYNVYIEYVDENNDIKQKSMAKYSTKKEAEKHLIEIKNAINKNKVVLSKDITLVERCFLYMDSNYKDASPYTIKNRTGWIKNQIAPFFLDTKLGDVTATQVQIFLNDLFVKYTSESAKVRYGFLRRVLHESYRLREIHENPCDFVEMPMRDDDFKVDVWTKEEAQHVIKSIEGELLEIPILLFLLVGLRLGEMTGLTWDCVDFDNKTITIDKILAYVDGKLFFKKPKTKKSNRIISIDDYLLEKLKIEKNKQDALIKCSSLENEFNLVCLNLRDKPYINSIVYSNFKKLCKKHNIRNIRIHDIRHTNATLLLLAGTNMKVISERLGHTDIRITMNRYAHVLKNMDRDASENLSNLLYD